MLLAAASTVAGIPAISAVLVIDDDGVAANLVRRALLEHETVAHERPVFVKRARQFVAKGASVHATAMEPSPSVGSLPLRSLCWPTTTPTHPAMRVVAAEHAIFPSSTRLTFDLGPTTARHSTSMCTSRSERSAEGEPCGSPVVRANFVRERGYDRSIVVTFELAQMVCSRSGPRCLAVGVGTAVGGSRARSADQSSRQATRGNAANESLASFSSPSKFAALSAGQKSSTWCAIRIHVLDLEDGLVLGDVGGVAGALVERVALLVECPVRELHHGLLELPSSDAPFLSPMESPRE